MAFIYLDNNFRGAQANPEVWHIGVSCLPFYLATRNQVKHSSCLNIFVIPIIMFMDSHALEKAC